MKTDGDFPQTINGIYFKSKVEYDKRYKSDLEAFAELLYDIYISGDFYEMESY